LAKETRRSLRSLARKNVDVSLIVDFYLSVL